LKNKKLAGNSLKLARGDFSWHSLFHIHKQNSSLAKFLFFSRFEFQRVQKVPISPYFWRDSVDFPTMAPLDSDIDRKTSEKRRFKPGEEVCTTLLTPNEGAFKG